MTDPGERLWRRAQGYLTSGQTAAARVVLESLLARNPRHIQAHLILGGIAWMDNRMRDAVRHGLDAARVVPDDGWLLAAAIAALLQVGEHATARDLLRRPALAQVRDGAVLVQLAGWQQMLGDHPAALALYERAHAAGVDGAEYRFHHATQLSFNGRLKEAEDELERCVGLGVPLGRAFVELARLRRQTPERNHLPLLERMARIVTPGSEDHAALEFARYKELEDLGRFDEAWSALACGNALMAALTPHDAARLDRLLEGLRSRATPELVKPEGEVQQGPMPIFVIGMTRSGTTLLDRVLGNHSQVESAGELGDFGRQLRHVAGRCTHEMLDETLLERMSALDYREIGARYLAQTQWRAKGKSWFVDKLPANWQLAGLIQRALPQARIVHMVRDPMDVCFSNYRAYFGQAQQWNYDLDALARHHLQYRRTMAHWHALMPERILDVSYAAFVREPETVARGVFGFCGLAWEEGCADLGRNETAVATLSTMQVRGGIRKDAFDEWRPYAAQLAGLKAIVDGG